MSKFRVGDIVMVVGWAGYVGDELTEGNVGVVVDSGGDTKVVSVDMNVNGPFNWHWNYRASSLVKVGAL